MTDEMSGSEPSDERLLSLSLDFLFFLDFFFEDWPVFAARFFFDESILSSQEADEK